MHATRSRVRLLLPALALLAAVARADDRGTGPNPWRDRAALEALLSAALEAVSAETGVGYDPPPAVRLSSRRQLAQVLRADLGPALAVFGARTAAEADAASSAIARGMLAKYEFASHTIHVVPENAEWVAERLEDPALLSPEVLRVVLVHEAVHAQDFQRFPALEAARQGRTTISGLKAVGAVVEGHAQYVTARVAAATGIEDAFRRFSRAITALAPGSDAAQRILLEFAAAEMEFAYEQGRRFFEAVAEARGPEGVLAVLRDPPETVEAIENPARWLSPAGAGAHPDLDLLLEGYEPLLPVEGWSERRSPLLRTQLEAVFRPLADPAKVAVLAAYEEGRIRMAQRPDGGGMVVVLVARFAAPEDATHYLTLARRLSEAKDAALREGRIRIAAASYADGAGPQRALPGFSVAKTVAVEGAASQAVLLETTAVNRYVVEITLVDAPLEREALAAAVAVGAAAIEAALGEAAEAPHGPGAD
jgi:hypothetical protein